MGEDQGSSWFLGRPPSLYRDPRRRWGRDSVWDSLVRRDLKAEQVKRGPPAGREPWGHRGGRAAARGPEDHPQQVVHHLGQHQEVVHEPAYVHERPQTSAHEDDARQLGRGPRLVRRLHQVQGEQEHQWGRTLQR